MSSSSLQYFCNAKNETKDEAIKSIAAGLMELSKEISELKGSIESIRYELSSKS
jgi:hypothetical protein